MTPFIPEELEKIPADRLKPMVAWWLRDFAEIADKAGLESDELVLQRVLTHLNRINSGIYSVGSGLYDRRCKMAKKLVSDPVQLGSRSKSTTTTISSPLSAEQAAALSNQKSIDMTTIWKNIREARINGTKSVWVLGLSQDQKSILWNYGYTIGEYQVENYSKIQW